MNKFSKALEKISKAKEKETSKQAIRVEPVEEIRMEKPVEKTPRIAEDGPEQGGIIRHSNLSPCIISVHDPRNRISEQYRVLRTNIASLHKGSLKTILITSSVEGEGKTVTALNLSYTLAQDSTKKVLFIDADLRKTKTCTYLGLGNQRHGLHEVLEKQADFEKELIKTECPNLHMLAGSIPGSLANAAELLGSHAMKRLLDRVHNEYDYVIIDSPPIIPVTDAAVLGSLVDGVFLVFQAERTPKNTIKHAQQMFEQAQVNLLGYIMTNVRYISPGYRDYYYYAYN